MSGILSVGVRGVPSQNERFCRPLNIGNVFRPTFDSLKTHSIYSLRNKTIKQIAILSIPLSYTGKTCTALYFSLLWRKTSQVVGSGRLDLYIMEEN